MKKTVFIMLCISVQLLLNAQEVVKQKEVGLVFSDFNNFGLSFKTGTDRSLWRFNTIIISGNKLNETGDERDYKNSNAGFGFRIGKEQIKDITDNLELRLGADLSFFYSYSKTVQGEDGSTKRTSYQPGVNFILGLNYVLNEKFLIGAELLPGVSYTTGKSVRTGVYANNGEEEKVDISGFNFNISNGTVLISLAYRF